MIRLKFNDSIVISEYESFIINILKVFLMLQVFIGHVVSAWFSGYVFQGKEMISELIIILSKLLFRYGPECAILFVFLSGYFIGGRLLYSSILKLECKLSLFLKYRLIKLYPVLIFSLMITALVDFIGLNFFRFDYDFISYSSLDLSATLQLKTFILNGLFLQPVFVDSFGSNGPLWTLGYIFQFYIVGFLVCRVVKKNIFIGHLLVFFMFIIMALVKAEWGLMFLSWWIGALSRVYRFELNLIKVSKFYFFLPIIIIFFSNFINYNYAIMLVSLSGCIFVSLINNINIASFLHKQKNIIIYLSKNAFSIYALHFPITLLISQLISDLRISLVIGMSVSVFLTLILVLGLSGAMNYFFRKIGCGNNGD